ncbi:hypothetical protein ABZP36_034643 [Zizania latifolia]
MTTTTTVEQRNRQDMSAAASCGCGGVPSHRRLVEQHLASLPHGLPPLAHVQGSSTRRLASTARSSAPTHSGACPTPHRDTFTYSFPIKELSAAGAGPVRAVHSHVVKIGSIEDTFFGNALIGAYSKNGGFLDGRQEDVRRNAHAGHRVLELGHGDRRPAMVPEGEVSGARKMFDEMPERDTVSWNTMSDGYTKAGDEL